MKKTFHDDLKMIFSDFDREKIDSQTTSTNSFLVEVDYNHDISKSLREEINNRYKRSKTNKTYKFPRVSKNSSIRISKNTIKSNILRKPKKELNENKKNRSLSPYENTMMTTSKRKYFMKNEFLATAKTPMPMSITAKLKIPNKFPKLNKSSVEVKRLAKFTDLSFKKHL